jgi:hypothetical protein
VSDGKFRLIVPSGIKRGPPRLEDRGKTLKDTKPWERCTPPMSRRTWERRRKEREEK